MYESFFDLSSRPFPATPVVQYYFPTAVVEQARQTLIRIVDRAEGPGLIIGQPGLGKTLLLRLLDHHFQNVFHCIHLASAAIDSRKDLLQNVLFELDLPYRNMEEGELRLSLLDFLRPSDSCPNGVLLLVDEAHTLPLQLLDEIRMITNLVRDGQPRVRLVLAGDMQLDDVFADPRLDSFNQRIAARCYLEPLNQEQTIEYVQAQIATIGGEPSGIFTHDALVAVHRASGGIPRLINQVCDHALVMASLGGYHQLEAAGIEEAWADLQQLPGPWNEPAAEANPDAQSIVEFGSLDDGDAVATQTGDESVNQLNDGSDEPSFAAADSAPITIVTGGEVDSAEWDPVANTPAGLTSEANEETAATFDVAELETFADPANGTPVGSESPDTHLPITELPESDLPESDLPESDLPESDLPESDTCGQPFEPVGASQPDILLGGEGADYYDSNVVQAGWVNASDSISITAGNALAAEQPADAPAEPNMAGEDTAEAASEVSENTPEFVDPFGQGFEEEEVVVDRYADQNGGVFAGCPQVNSEEGRALAAIIERHSSPRLSVVDADTDADVDRPTSESDDTMAEPEVATAEPEVATTEPEVATADGQGAVAEATDEAAAEQVAADESLAQSLQNNVFDTSSLSDWLFASTTQTVGADGTEAQQVNLESEVPAPPVADESCESSQPEPVDNQQPAEAPQIAVVPSQEVLEPSFLQVHEGPSINDDRDMIVIDEDKNGGVFLTQSSDELARRVEYQQLFSQLREG